eukprot:jgi/Bigna1/146138/aug1.109_g20846
MYDEGLQEALWKASRIRVTQFLDQKQERMEDQGGQPLAEEDDDDDDDGKKPNSGLKKNAIDDCDNNGLHPDQKDGDGDSLTEHMVTKKMIEYPPGEPFLAVNLPTLAQKFLLRYRSVVA